MIRWDDKPVYLCCGGPDMRKSINGLLCLVQENFSLDPSKSYMWLYRTSGEAKHQILVYEYQPDRKHIHPEEFLIGFSGYFHADGYDGYHKLPDRISVVGCWAMCDESYSTR